MNQNNKIKYKQMKKKKRENSGAYVDKGYDHELKIKLYWAQKAIY